VDVGQDFDALFLVGRNELVERIVSLAEVSAVSLATTLLQPSLLPQLLTLQDGIVFLDLIEVEQMLQQVLTQEDILSNSTALLNDDLPIP